METPIGTIYSTNITPDKEHGIGGYTFEEFDDAVRKGVRKDGSTLYPAMPYPSFARISEADMRAMYAYFMHGVEPVNVANKDTDNPMAAVDALAAGVLARASSPRRRATLSPTRRLTRCWSAAAIWWKAWALRRLSYPA
ncbi:gluconate 2-dehydrogenase [Klebsiella pneumoniae]|uniref:Gluconate 2-dehydrogenase n=1 Tax=Klebsiella pneumoniae TaxID=573 RepID=A0A3S4H8M8_KLEPN|nr:gluconate 2-dehydrogenase [Klebsiella pneumoniae]